MMVRPTILIDMRKHRIRIHKHTLQAIGDPDFVMLIINPIEYTLGIKYGVPDDKLALRIRKSTLRNDYELYSKSLMAALHQLCPEWKERENYRLEGELIATENMAVFSMRDYTVVEH